MRRPEPVPLAAGDQVVGANGPGVVTGDGWLPCGLRVVYVTWEQPKITGRGERRLWREAVIPSSLARIATDHPVTRW